MTTTPTPRQLAASLTDLGRGFTAEVFGPGTPDPALGRHVVTMASRIAHRVAVDDPGSRRSPAGPTTPATPGSPRTSSHPSSPVPATSTGASNAGSA
jgi:hypothetical protein